MKTPEEIKLVTVGALTKDLKRFTKKHADDDVVCYAEDGEAYYVETLNADDDGDLWIGVNDEEYDGGYYTVEMLLTELERYDAATRVYMGGFGEYMTFEAFPSTLRQAQDKLRGGSGRIFTYDEENEVVGSDGIAFEPKDDSGHVREPQRREGRGGQTFEVRYGLRGGVTEAEERELAEKPRKEQRSSMIETVVLALLTLAAFGGLCYHLYGLVATTGAVWAHVLWGIAFLVCTAIGSLTLYFSEK